MATYTGADKRLQYLFSHIGDGSNMSGTAQPTGTAVDNTLYIQYDANDGTVVALWVYLNGTWTEVETSGGNLYGTDEPTEEADEGALYIQYDSSDYSVTALWAYIGAGWREIQLGGGGGASGGARYTETVLWSGSQTTTGTITLSDSISNYDLLLLEYGIASNPNEVLQTMVISTSDALESAPTLPNRKWRLNNSLGNVDAVTDMTFTSDTEITIGYVTRGYLRKVIGIKWEIQETALIYSEEEREVGVWTDGKPLYQKTIIYTPSSSDSTVDLSSLNIDKITGYDGYWTRYDGGIYTQYPFGRTETPTYNSYDVNVRYTSDSKLRFIISGYSVSQVNEIRYTIRYTKSTDVAGSGTYITTGGYAHHYSTTEHVVGTWIDGKPLYEKTVEYTGTLTVDNSFVNNVATLSDVDGFLKCEGYFKRTNSDGLMYVVNGGIRPESDASSRLSARYYNGYVQVAVNGFRDIEYLALTIQYTKTTD